MNSSDTVSSRLQYYQRRGKNLLEKGDSIYHKRGKEIVSFLRYDEAATFYFQAAISFKCCGQWRQAADALMKCANMHMSINLKVEAATFSTQAAEIYMKVDRGEAIRAYRAAISIYCDCDMLSLAGKLERTLARLAYSDKHWEDAAAHYVKASNFLSGEMMFDQGDLCLIKAATCFIEMGEYAEASRVYQIVARGSADSNLKSFQACEYLLRSLLCMMATPLQVPLLDDGTQDLSKRFNDGDKYAQVASTMLEFTNIDYRWSTSKEISFAENIILARLNFSLDEFADHVYWWHNIRPLDKECIMLLQVVRKEIEFELDRREKYGYEVQVGADEKMKRRELNKMINRINEENSVDVSFLTEGTNDAVEFVSVDGAANVDRGGNRGDTQAGMEGASMQSVTRSVDDSNADGLSESSQAPSHGMLRRLRLW